jgi:hypothetical protein
MKRTQFPFYLILSALFPALSLAGNNISQMELIDLFRPLIFSLIFSLLIFLVITLLIRNTHLAGLISLLILVLFFTYGHVFNLLYPVRILGFRLARNSILLILYGLIFLVGVFAIFKNKSGLARFVPALNVLAILLLVFPIFQISRFLIEQEVLTNQQKSDLSGDYLTLSQNKSPDIYLIVLDGYNRADILADDFGYDNSPFLNGLREMGFYVADCSRSNYDHTNLTLASELNLEYVQDLVKVDTFTDYETNVNALFDQSLVRRELEQAGYRTYQFANDIYPWLNWNNVELLTTAEEGNFLFRNANPFELMFIDTTMMKVISLHFPELFDSPEEIEISGIESRMLHENFILDTLPTLVRKPGQKFVYAHLLISHAPFIFTSVGELIDDRFRESPLSEETYREGYINQIEYLNQRLIQVLKGILEESKEPPIIILQADHGNKNNIGDRVDRPNQILNAYYLPGLRVKPYASISTVNTFRFIFNNYFSTDLDYLEDRTYTLVNMKNHIFKETFEEQENCK